MPSKTALTPAVWREKLLAVIPPWVLEDVEESILSAHIAGWAGMFSVIEQDLYDHIDETFVARASEAFQDAMAQERLVPDLGYTGDGRVRQLQRMFNRLTKAQLELAINDLLPAIPCELEIGLSGIGSTVIELDYDDDDEHVIDWTVQENLFNVIIEPQIELSFDYIDRDCYCDSAYAGYTTLGMANIVKRAVDFYKAEGIRFRISERD